MFLIVLMCYGLFKLYTNLPFLSGCTHDIRIMTSISAGLTILVILYYIDQNDSLSNHSSLLDSLTINLIFIFMYFPIAEVLIFVLSIIKPIFITSSYILVNLFSLMGLLLPIRIFTSIIISL